MIVYSANKQTFVEDVILNRIETKILQSFQKSLGHRTSKSEIESWRNSMMYMNNILSDSDIPEDVGVSIEYRIPQTSKRIDFILSGKNSSNKSSIVIVELKQWSEVNLTDKDGIVETYLGGAKREVNHPSYQAWTYAALLEDYNETVQEQNVQISPCAYVHNCNMGNVLLNDFYRTHTEKAPTFLRDDALKLRAFIKDHVKYGDNAEIIYQIDNGKIRPSKNLADKLASMLKGNQEFLMIDDQKLVFETAMDLAAKSTPKKKQVLIVEGGPGSGKSVVAINLLVKFTEMGLTSQYVTKNAAPRSVYEIKLTGSFTKNHISNLFVGSGKFTECEINCFDTLIVDEAHRLNEKSGLFSNKGDNQVKEIIYSSKFSVFFIDESQKITLKDIGTKGMIRWWARKLNANVTELELSSQFRCNGSDGYIAWLDNLLQIKETANESIGNINYDFKVFDDPCLLRNEIVNKNRMNNKSRIVAGYCWDWVSKKDNKLFDIVIGDEFKMQWNLTSHGSAWIIQPNSISEAGCIHTCQGLELDYVGVIIGPDLIVRDGKMITDGLKRAGTDQSIKGFKKKLKEHRESAITEVDIVIRNTYRTLMTRGMKGCYIYSVDKETREYFQQALKENESEGY